MQVVRLKKEELPYEINEELKLLRTNILFCGADKRVILLTSAFSGEGKSTVALNLCRSLAELGKRVVLIDADMRKSVLKEKVARATIPEKGLSHFLSGQCAFSDIVCKTKLEEFFIVFAGAVPPNPSELLSSVNMINLIKYCREKYDYVIIDSPPIGVVVDSAVVAPLCDGTLILVEAGEVKYRLAQEVVEKMRTTGTPILGVILNKVDYHKGGYYSYSHYGKYSKYYERYGKYY